MQRRSADQLSFNIERVVDGGVSGEKPLGVKSRPTMTPFDIRGRRWLRLDIRKYGRSRPDTKLDATDLLY
jgi:hypothetical protein